MSKPLEGIKVIDFAGVQAGPVCAQFLAWYGADVIKVERVEGGDITRHQLRDIPDVDALYFTMHNSNKRSIALDTKSPEGKEVFEKLLAWADVIVENFRPGAMDRMGFGWERLHEINPRLIWGSIRDFMIIPPLPISASMKTSRNALAVRPQRPAIGMGNRPYRGRHPATITAR